MTRNAALPLALGLLLLVLAPRHAAAQVVRGVVVHEEDGTPVPQATVLLSRVSRNITAQAVTDSAGRFQVRVHPRGEYDISVGRLDGWVNVGRRLALMREDTFTVRLEIPREVVRLPALKVLAHTRSPRLEAVGYYWRSLSGMGTYIGPGRIGARNWLFTSRLLSSVSTRIAIAERTPYQTASSDAFAWFRPEDTFGEAFGRCIPTLWVDGMSYGRAYADVVDLVVPEEIEGIEIYPSSFAAPPQFAGSSSLCGAILLWLRHGGGSEA